MTTPAHIDTPAAAPPASGGYKWYVLTLAALTHALVMGMPTMALPVLFDEIAAEFDLSLVQVGFIWGVAPLAGLIMALLGGAIGDRIGARRALMFGCLIAGVTGALRSFAVDFFTLAATVLIAGMILPAIPTNVHKTCAIWFSARRLGAANGVVSAGMALGFMIGALLSATVLSPLLGGWRNVIFFFAAIALAVGGFWAITRDGPNGRRQPSNGVPLRAGLLHVAKTPNIWLVALTLFGISGCVQGTLGYLPLYLRGIGWAPATADAALSSFHASSLLFAIPFALLSDRLGRRRPLLIIASLMIAAGIGALAVVDGALVWPAVIFAGMVRDGFMAIIITVVMELRGIGPRYAATATGFIMAITWRTYFRPAGNSLAAIDRRPSSSGRRWPYSLSSPSAASGRALTARHEITTNVSTVSGMTKSSITSLNSGNVVLLHEMR